MHERATLSTFASGSSLHLCAFASKVWSCVFASTPADLEQIHLPIQTRWSKARGVDVRREVPFPGRGQRGVRTRDVVTDDARARDVLCATKGDIVPLGPIALLVHRVTDGRVTSVGLRLAEEEEQAPATFMGRLRSIARRVLAKLG